MGVRRYLGRHARDGHTAGLVICAGALVFNVAWLLAPLSFRGSSPTGLPIGPLFVVIATANAYLATRLVWWAIVPTDGAFSRERALGVGLALAPVSMFTFAAIGLPLMSLLDSLLTGSQASGFPTDLGGLLTFPVTLVFLGLVGTAVGLRATFGIPFLITTGGAVGLAYLEKQYG